MSDTPRRSMLDGIIWFCLDNKVIVALAVAFFIAWGILVAPFDWDLGELPRDPVPVDAIPDIGESQQIVFTAWPGHSPQDVEEQITYNLTTALLGVPEVKSVRGLSMFGFSMVYVIFREQPLLRIGEKGSFYWCRTRVLEKLNSLPPGLLPQGVRPTLGPDATALGQVFWYTIEGEDEDGNATGGWDLDELRSVQDWYVRYHLLAARGKDGASLIAEVASIGGFVREYQVDVDPDAMRAHGVTLQEVVAAVRSSNLDVGAGTIEVNNVEYVVRGIGFIKDLADIEYAVVKVNDNVPIYVKTVAKVGVGPEPRRGVLDKEGAEVVGGVVIVRDGENPLAAIKSIKDKIAEIESGLPSKTLPDGTISRLKIIPFYDRTGLIYETLGTLDTALTHQILVTVIVVLVMMMHLRSSLLISGLLPLAVLMCFIAMKLFNVDANVVALSGIAIAIGTMVDMGIVICENILKHLNEGKPGERRIDLVYRASREVGGAVLTAVATTIVGFLPVFTLQGEAGKLFRPLAFTKTFALFASIIVALAVIPPLAHLLLGWQAGRKRRLIPERIDRILRFVLSGVAVLTITYILTADWQPLGPEKGIARNLLFVGGIIGGMLGFFHLFKILYPSILGFCLRFKALFMPVPIMIIFLGLVIWLGFDTFFGWLPQSVRTNDTVSKVAHAFPGLEYESRPSLDEGSFLYMPSTMAHASVGEAIDMLRKQDMAISGVPEVRQVVGKIGRAETPLDPAPLSMVETVINYWPEYMTDQWGRRRYFKYTSEGEDFFRNEDGEPIPAFDGEPYKITGRFIRDDNGKLIEDEQGKPFRLWRPKLDPALNPDRDEWQGIRTPKDIWDRIADVAHVPGSTPVTPLQPIETRLLMLATGTKAKMAVKIKATGTDLKTVLSRIEAVGIEIERHLKDHPSINADVVSAERIVGKPYLEIIPDTEAIARYGLNKKQINDVVEIAIGGKRITTTVEGRERYPVRVRYLRELRDSVETMGRILVPAPGGSQIPLDQLAKIEFVRGPQVVKSEDGFLVGYVTFDAAAGVSEITAVEHAIDWLKLKQDQGELILPDGVTYEFTGGYEQHVRTMNRLMIALPAALLIIFFILYLQFKTLTTSLMVFSGIAVAWAGGFVIIGLYGTPWFLDFAVFGVNMRELFHVGPINMSVAIWVGFLALFGIASDDGVVMATYLEDTFKNRKPKTKADIREAVIAAGKRRIRPCLMTTATTILALIPVLTSTGRGADIMGPMAIPVFGGMLFEILTMLVVPVLYCMRKEAGLALGSMLSSPLKKLAERLNESDIETQESTPGGNVDGT